MRSPARQAPPPPQGSPPVRVPPLARIPSPPACLSRRPRSPPWCPPPRRDASYSPPTQEPHLQQKRHPPQTRDPPLGLRRPESRLGECLPFGRLLPRGRRGRRTPPYEQPPYQQDGGRRGGGVWP